MPVWKPDDRIRHRETGEILLVVHTYRNCTIVVHLKDNSPLVQPLALLSREYPNYFLDMDMENSDRLNYDGDWFPNIIKM